MPSDERLDAHLSEPDLPHPTDAVCPREIGATDRLRTDSNQENRTCGSPTKTAVRRAATTEATLREAMVPVKALSLAVHAPAASFLLSLDMGGSALDQSQSTLTNQPS